mmetsp:Transcript_31434/g.35198  ORF Transcript_31434/g.35198 Transcript_31434/m.35198 type:complete len:237 (+) Transcript_31434:257-967(+)
MIICFFCLLLFCFFSFFLFDNVDGIGKLSNHRFLFETIVIRPHKGQFSFMSFAGLADSTSNRFGLRGRRQHIVVKVGIVIGLDQNFGFDRPGHRCIDSGRKCTIIPGGTTLFRHDEMGNVLTKGRIGNMWMTILSTIGTKKEVWAPTITGIGRDRNFRTIMGTSPLFDIVGIIFGTATTVFFKADRRGKFFLFGSTRVSNLVDKFQFVITTLRGEGGRIFHDFTWSTWIECTKTVK